MLYHLPLLTSETVQKNKTQKVNRVKQLERPQKQIPSMTGVKGQLAVSSLINNKDQCLGSPDFSARH